MGDAAPRAFPEKYDLVQDWLDEALRPALDVRGHARRAKDGAEWIIDLSDLSDEIRDVRLHLPPSFPTEPCRLYVDRKHFLRVPHVEGDGHVCLGLASIPADYERPADAVVRALETFKTQILAPMQDPQWRREQFQAERDSYWTHWRQSLSSSRAPVTGRTLVDVGTLDKWQTGTVVSYAEPRFTHRRYRDQVAVVGDADPHQLARRHGWAEGTMVRGNALFVRLPDDQPWTPTTWPKTFLELDALVAGATSGQIAVSTWLDETGWGDDPKPKARRRRRWRGGKRPPVEPRGQRPLLVILILETSVFGYQVIAPVVPGLTDPHIAPAALARIDPDWALARDQQLATLHARRAKRVLVLGCGSLASPLIMLLARAGIGHLDLVDAQRMGTENTARHELGIDEVDDLKAPALAARLVKQIPGISVRGFRGDVVQWCPMHCAPGGYDLVIECTGESSVRTYLSHKREALFGDTPIVHAWVEPLCSAGHVVLTMPSVPWPSDDPADDLINATDLSAADTRIRLPGCAAGFHPYGAADVTQVAAFAAERIISTLDAPPPTSTVWSWVRSSAFFEALEVPVAPRCIVPHSDSPEDSATTTRTLAAVLKPT